MSMTLNLPTGAIRLASIAVTTPPTKTSYYVGDTFNAAGMVVTATYSNGATLAVGGYTVSPATLALADVLVTITYVEGGVSKATTQAVTVSKETLTVPTQSGALTYSGSAQTPAWSGYDSTKMTLGGTTSGTNAGSYNATFTLRNTDRCQWSGGTTGAKTVAWAIGKAAGSLSISPTSMALSASTPSGTIAVTRAGDGAISASSSDTSVATTSISGTTVTVTGVASGNATITVNVAAGTNHTAPTSKTCSVTGSFLNNTFSANEWSAIIAACASGSVPSTWVVGNQKAMTIGGTTYTVTIIGANHDTYSGGGTAPLTFQLQDVYGTRYQMNTSDTNIGGWASCAMRTTSLPAILALMPAEVRAGIREVNKLTSAGARSSTINTTADKLFLLSEVEIFGSVAYSKSGEGTQYAYYAAGNSNVKYLNASEHDWKERSPRGNSSTDFCLVDRYGNASYWNAASSDGVAFGFCF